MRKDMYWWAWMLERGKVKVVGPYGNRYDAWRNGLDYGYVRLATRSKKKAVGILTMVTT